MSTPTATPSRAAARSRPEPFRLDHAGDLLTLTEFAAVYRIAVTTVRKRLRLKTLTPWPFATRPYRWRTADVLADLARHPRSPRRRAKMSRPQ